MSFNQIVWKMIKHNYKKYMFYYLCNSLTVMLFFIFSTLYFNEQVVELKETESIQYVLMIPGVSLITFTLIFISYAHNIFIKQRKSEFGLFLTLGMSNRDIARLLLFENSLIALISIISGLIAGFIFSKLFFLILFNFVGIEGFTFHLNVNMYLFSIIIYCILFFIAVSRSLFLIIKRNVIENLRSDQVAETINMKNPIIGGIGIAFVIASIIGLYLTYSDPMLGSAYSFLWVMMTLLGLYIGFSQFTSFFIEVAKNNKHYYYKRLLFFTNLDYKIKRLTSILFLITVMIWVTILYSTIQLFIYMDSERDIITSSPFDIAVFQTKNANSLSKDEIYAIVDEKENPVLEYIELQMYSYYEKSPYTGIMNTYHFMTNKEFKKLISDEVVIQNDEYLYYINDDLSIDDVEDYFKSNAFAFDDMNLTLDVKDFIVGRHINLLSDVIIINEYQLEQLKNKLDVYETSIHLINVANWKESNQVVETLTEEFNKRNDLDSVFPSLSEEFRESLLSEIDSKIEAQTWNKSSNGLLFYVMTILTVIFFIGSFVLLYLNLYSDIDKEKQNYQKLHHIGITHKEMKRIISREITTLFFIPTMTGIIIAFLYIVAMIKEDGGIVQNKEVLGYFLLITCIYHLIQFVFYLFTRKKLFISLTKQ